MPIEKPKTRFKDLSEGEKILIRKVALDFMKYKDINARMYKLLKLPMDDVHQAIIDMLDYGLLRIVDSGECSLGLEIYDYMEDIYERI